MERAFLHGGASTMYGIGQPLDADSWNVAVVDPGRRTNRSPSWRSGTRPCRFRLFRVNVSRSRGPVTDMCWTPALENLFAERYWQRPLPHPPPPPTPFRPPSSCMHARFPDTGRWSFDQTVKAPFPVASCTTGYSRTVRRKASHPAPCAGVERPCYDLATIPPILNAAP